MLAEAYKLDSDLVRKILGGKLAGFGMGLLLTSCRREGGGGGELFI